MITLNKRKAPWRDGMTVRQILDENNYVYRRITVKINGELVPETEWLHTKIADGDIVETIHLMAGG